MKNEIILFENYNVKLEINIIIDLVISFRKKE